MKSERMRFRTRMRRRLARTCAIALSATTLVAIAVMLLYPVVALARAGGGGGYSGGGSSSGGGGGGGCCEILDLILLLIDLIRLCYYYPYVGFPVVFVILGIIVFSCRSGADAYKSSVIRRGGKAARQNQQARAVRKLREKDPGFDPAAFGARVEEAFTRIQLAWSTQDLAPVRPFISDAVHERFSIQFREQKALGFRNKMEQVKVQAVDLISARADGEFDVVHVRILASAIDQEVALADGRVLRGSSSPEEFSEVWTFVRRRGAQTRPGHKGLIEGNCPNCGGAIALNQAAQCAFCKALLRSGRYDWVLVEITQECEWRSGQSDRPANLLELRQRDPQLNVQELEDRASVIFWRRAEAERVNSARPIRKVALPAYSRQFEQAAAPRQGKSRWFYGRCAVGSVDTLGFLPAKPENGDGFDRALVEVRWSGTRLDVRDDGTLVEGEQSSVSRLLLVLVRKNGAQTNADHSISSAHCPNCGAPESGGDSDACEFCDAALADGSHAWVLEESVGMNTQRGHELVGRLNSIPVEPAGDDTAADAPEADAPAMRDPGHPAALDALAWMIKMAFADGQVDPAERKIIDSVARRYEIDCSRVDQLIHAATAGQLDVPAPADRDQARAQLKAMAGIALADGKIDRREYDLLRQAGNAIGLSDHDVKQLLKQARSEAFTQSREELRQARRNRRGS